MAPWVGRVAGARLEWEGRAYELEPNLPPHAIHGVVFDEAWTLDEISGEKAVLSCRFDEARWPLGGGTRQRIYLSSGSLTLEATVSAGASSMPAAVGWHPWFKRPERGAMRVRVDSSSVLVTSPDRIPTGEVEAVNGDTDLRAGPSLGDRRLDHVYAHARAPAFVAWPDLVMELGFEAPLGTVVVYTPRDGVCVEPQSAWPDAPRLARVGVPATGLARLEAGEELTARTTWTWERA